MTPGPGINVIPARNAAVVHGPGTGPSAGRIRSLLLLADPDRPGWLSIDAADVPQGGDPVGMWNLDRPAEGGDPLDPPAAREAPRPPERPLSTAQARAHEVLAATGRLGEACAAEMALSAADAEGLPGALAARGWRYGEWIRTAGCDMKAGEEAFSACPSDADLASIRWYAAPGREGETRRQAAASMPLFAGLIARNPALRACVDRQQPLAEHIRRMFPSLGTGGIRRLGRVSSGTADQGVLGEAFTVAQGEDVLGHRRQRRLPLEGPWRTEEAVVWLEELAAGAGGVDCIPSTDRDWESCSAIWSGLLLLVSTHLGTDFLAVKPPGGDWRRMHEILARDLDWPHGGLPERRDLNIAVVDAIEIADRMALDIVLPVIHQAVSCTEAPDGRALFTAHLNSLLRKAAHEMFVPPRTKQPLRALAAMVRGGLTRLDRVEVIRSADGNDGPARPPEDGRNRWEREGWEVPHRAPIRLDGATITFIPDREGLRREGRTMQHCIGRLDYWRRCWQGTGTAAHVALDENRAPAGGRGKSARGATAFFRVEEDGRLSLEQFHGHRNAHVWKRGNPLHGAVLDFLDRQDRGEFTPDPKWGEFLAWTATEEARTLTQADGPRGEDPFQAKCGYDPSDAGRTEALWREWRNLVPGGQSIFPPARAVWRSPSARAALGIISPSVFNELSSRPAPEPAGGRAGGPAP